MKKNLLLILAIFILVVLAFNSFGQIVTFRGTSALVGQEEQKLIKLKQENQDLKQELLNKKSDRFVEGEIRNKLGLAKEGEEIVVIPNKEEDVQQASANKKAVPNWKKWKKLLFGA